jgi:hypothetical protein
VLHYELQCSFLKAQLTLQLVLAVVCAIMRCSVRGVLWSAAVLVAKRKRYISVLISARTVCGAPLRCSRCGSRKVSRGQRTGPSWADWALDDSMLPGCPHQPASTAETLCVCSVAQCQIIKQHGHSDDLHRTSKGGGAVTNALYTMTWSPPSTLGVCPLENGTPTRAMLYCSHNAT